MTDRSLTDPARLNAIREIADQLVVLLDLADEMGEDVLAAHLSMALDTVSVIAENEGR